jgi:signal transduction histidine kinase
VATAKPRAGAEQSTEAGLGLLRAIGRHLDRTSDPATFFGGLTATVARLVGAERAAFWLLDPVAGTLTAQPDGHGFPPEAMSLMRDVPCRRDGDGVADRVVHRDAVVGPVSVDERDLDADRALLRTMGVRDLIAAAWCAGDRPLGMLAAYDSTRRGGFTQADVLLLRTAGLAAGLVWQQHRAEERERAASAEARRRVRELALVQEASRALTSTPDLQAVCRAVARATALIVSPMHVRHRRASVLRFDGTRLGMVAEYDVEGPGLEGAEWELQQYLEVREVLERGKPMPRHFAHVPEMPRVARDIALRTGLRSMAMVALDAAGEPFGLLSVGARDDAGLSDGHLREIETIANLAELAISNAMHFEAMRREAEQAAALEETKSKFLRLASHELRGPVAVLRGYLSMLQDGTFGAPGEDLTEVYRVMTAKAGQLEMLVTQMLEAARLEGGRLRLRLEPTDLRAPVEEAFETVRLLATDGHHLHLEQPAHPVWVTGDPWRLTTIVGNLLDNAVKYSPDGGPVRCRVLVEDTRAVVEVSDRGLGIAEEDVPTLFTRFGRIVTPANSHILGTGLGLYLCRELAHMHDGELNAESTPGEGSVFRLRVPLAKEGGVGASAALDRVFERS